MPELRCSVRLAAPIERVFTFFADAGNLEVMTARLQERFAAG